MKLLTTLILLSILAATADASDRPNVVLIFIDDLGWKDVGCYGNDFVETPRIDRLAAEGVRFTDFYAAGAVCSPTRCALQADDTVADLAPLKGEKGSLHEGGVRVPLIVKYPPLSKAGAVCSEPTISYDFYPTLVDIAGGKLPHHQTIDGLSLQPLLSDPHAKLDRNALH
jgi:arylsulfatase A-like enzyme